MPPKLKAAWKLGMTGRRSAVTRSTAALLKATLIPPYAAPKTGSTAPSAPAECVSGGSATLSDSRTPQQDLGAHPGVAAAGYSCFALAMTIGRLGGTTLLERLGRTRTVVAGGAMAADGMLLGSLAPSVWATLLGFAVTGLGLANIFPVAIERAGALAGPSGVATASTLGYGGMLLGPPAIGFMADWFSLPIALTSVAALAAVAALIGVMARHTAEH